MTRAQLCFKVNCGTCFYWWILIIGGFCDFSRGQSRRRGRPVPAVRWAMMTTWLSSSPPPPTWTSRGAAGTRKIFFQSPRARDNPLAWRKRQRNKVIELQGQKKIWTMFRSPCLDGFFCFNLILIGYSDSKIAFLKEQSDEKRKQIETVEVTG